MPADPLAPAADLAAQARQAWLGETATYCAAREALLAEEIELRRHLERVAALRRALPPGPPITTSYAFIDETGASRTLPDLFGDHDTLIVYCWMFGPARARPCPMCTNLLGPLDGNAADLEQQVALAVIGRSPIARQIAFKAERGWRHLKLYETDDAFPRDFRALAPDGDEWPALLVFIRDDTDIWLHWAGEMSGVTADPGQDPRGAPDLAPLWNLLDLTPRGRDQDWYPKLAY
ncbi:MULTISPECIES: DUF899 family protein [unclassified Sphingomonas]|nr:MULTISPECIES: DUF899 family protein [unclassified Sphingomonas]